MQSLQFIQDCLFKSDEEGGRSSPSTESGWWSASSELKLKSRRQRKSSKQVEFLVSQFYENPAWTREQIQLISKQTQLSELQVYKWGWDFRKKLAQDNLSLECIESLYPSKSDLSMLGVQKEFREAVTQLHYNY